MDGRDLTMSQSISFDLFAGAGGASEGMIAAACKTGEPIKRLAAVNHWQVAIETHRRNHPWADHYCEDIRRIDPRCAVGRGRVRMGVAGPDCTDHSNAKGGKPRNTGLRALAWDVVRWARLTEAESLVIENVPEFVQWGPLDDAGKPIKDRRGEFFREFIAALRRLGYTVDWRILRACDYGDATTRRRLFIQARQYGSIVWPNPSHGDAENLFGLPSYRPAREIIDWSLPAESIFARKKALAETTMARIADGIARFCGEPFLVGIGGPRGRQTVKGIGDPYRTVLAQCHDYLCEPFLIRYNGGGRVQSVDRPLTTLDTSNRFALVQAFLISYYGNGKAHGIDAPLPTVTTRDRFGLVEVERTLAEKGLAIADIRLRMLEPQECAAAHSFDDGYQFEGNREQRMAQVGHSWPIRTGTAVCWSALTGESEVPA